MAIAAIDIALWDLKAESAEGAAWTPGRFLTRVPATRAASTCGSPGRGVRQTDANLRAAFAPSR